MTTLSFSAMWQYDKSSVMADPGVRRYRDNGVGSQLALSVTDEDSIDRGAQLRAVAAGDRIALRSTATADSWGTLEVIAAPVDLTTWVRFDVQTVNQGSATAPPGMNDRILFDFLTEPSTPADALPAWVDPEQVLSDVLDVLRLSPTDDDVDRIEAQIPTAAELVANYLDRYDDPLPDAPPMHPLVRTAMTNATVELYRRKDAPFGVLNGWSPDEMAIRVSSDPLRGVMKILLPLKQKFGVA